MDRQTTRQTEYVMMNPPPQHEEGQQHIVARPVPGRATGPSGAKTPVTRPA